MTELNVYLSLPYTKTLRRDEDGTVIASIQEFSGCVAHGTTETEALAKLSEVQRAWLEASLSGGQPIPAPDEEESLPSGKWVQRVPRSLHKALGALAKREDTSLNQLVTTILAEAVGQRRAIAFEPAARAHSTPVHSPFSHPYIRTVWQVLGAPPIENYAGHHALFIMPPAQASDTEIDAKWVTDDRHYHKATVPSAKLGQRKTESRHGR
jgi:antitoxin HicB